MKKNTKVTDADFSKMKKVYRAGNRYVEKGFHLYFSYNLRIFMMFVVVFVVACISYKCFVDSYTEVEDVQLTYKEKANIDYNVKLLENNLFENGNLNAVNGYISELIDDISTDFTYNYSLDKESSVKYSYYVTATMELKNNKDGSVISSKSDNLVEKTTKELDGVKEISIRQNVNLDYDHYNNIAKTVKDGYSMDVNGNLILKMYINIDTKNEVFEKDLSKTQVVEVNIPLLSSQVNASMVDKIDNEDVYIEHKNPVLKSESTLYVGVSLLILDIIYLMSGLAFMFRAKPKKSKYVRLRDGLLKDYDRVIVNSKNIPDTNGYNIIDCYSFSELMDAQRLLGKPIIYHEIVKNQKSVFIIIGDTDVYKFVLKECDIDFN